MNRQWQDSVAITEPSMNLPWARKVPVRGRPASRSVGPTSMLQYRLTDGRVVCGVCALYHDDQWKGERVPWAVRSCDECGKRLGAVL